MPQAGELFHYPNYVFPDGGQKDKYVLLMGQTRGGDWILARTTSRAHGRPQEPRCFHGNPYPGSTWVRRMDFFLWKPGLRWIVWTITKRKNSAPDWKRAESVWWDQSRVGYSVKP